jgi:hypothetical protein
MANSKAVDARASRRMRKCRWWACKPTTAKKATAPKVTPVWATPLEGGRREDRPSSKALAAPAVTPHAVSTEATTRARAKGATLVVHEGTGDQRAGCMGRFLGGDG